MPYYVGGVVDEEKKLIARTLEVFREKYNIEVKPRHQVLELDLPSRRVQVEQKENGKSRWEPFDQLLIATGAVPIWPRVSGSDAQGIYGVNTLQSGGNLKRLILEKKPRRGVVIGGGYIGLEMAEALTRRGLAVSLVELADEVMNTLDPDMGHLVSEALMDVGVALYRKERLQGFEVKNGHVTAAVTDKRIIPADLVILGMGVKPNSSLAERAGISLGVRGAIAVNDLMQTEIEGVWAAGDCAQTFHLVSRRPFHIALGTVANKMGRVAGINIGGGYARFPGVVGTAASKICAVEVARTGLQEKELRQLGWEYITETIKSTTRAEYYPHSETITVKVLAEKGSGRFLGGQIVGKEGAAKRIDILAAALHAGFTLDEMINLDLSYAPPYAPVWDPVIIAARQAVKQI